MPSKISWDELKVRNSWLLIIGNEDRIHKKQTSMCPTPPVSRSARGNKFDGCETEHRWNLNPSETSGSLVTPRDDGAVYPSQNLQDPSLPHVTTEPFTHQNILDCSVHEQLRGLLDRSPRDDGADFFDCSSDCRSVTFRSRPDYNCTAEVPSFTLRTALSAIPLVSDRCGVDVQWFSRRDLHMLCQIPRNCQCKWLLVSFRVPGTFASSFVFPEKFLFCTGTTGSIGWPSPAPRLHIDDCSRIHTLHWELCDPLLLNHQNFLHEVRLRECVFCTRSLWFWSSGRSRNFGLSGSEFLHCAHPKSTLLEGSKDG